MEVVTIVLACEYGDKGLLAEFLRKKTGLKLLRTAYRSGSADASPAAVYVALCALTRTLKQYCKAKVDYF